MKRRIPSALVWLRVALAPTVVALAFSRASGGWIVAALVVALVSDVYDGVLARRWGVATARLRVADSVADSFFYLCVLGAVLVRHPEVVRIHAVGLALLLGLEAARVVFDVLKYRRVASYHMWSAKVWGAVLAVGLVALFGWEATGWPVELAIWLGVLTNLEGLAASVVLSGWHHDIPSLVHALRVQRDTSAAHLP